MRRPSDNLAADRILFAEFEPSRNGDHRDDLGTFLAELYGHAERGELVFNYERGSAFCTSWHGIDRDGLTEAARRQTGNVWVPIGSRREQLPDGQRGGADEVLDVFGFAVDLDVACAWHTREDLPPDLDSARVLLDLFPLKPTTIHNTGGGLQAWWMFPEPIAAEDARPVLGRWGVNWRELGRRRGWHVDSTASLDHVFRLPGTRNVAADAFVTIEQAGYGRRYGLDDLDEHCVAEELPPPPKPKPRPRVEGEPLAGDRYNATHTCDDLLLAAGCALSHVTRDGDRHYFAPHHVADRDRTGATVYADGHCAIWSETFAGQHGLKTALGDDRTTYDAFGLFAHFDHGGDFSAAAKAYAKLDPPKPTPLPAVEPPQPAPSGVDPDTGEVSDARPQLPDELWRHPRLAHVRQAAHARGRAAGAVLACVLVHVAAELEHLYVLPPIVGADGSLNLAAALIADSGLGKSTADSIAEELLEFTGRTATPRPRGLSLGSGEGVAEAYMGSRAATDDEQAAGLGKSVREQTRWNERFVGDEGQAVLAVGKRSGATLLPTLRTLVTGGALGQQNAATDNRRLIPAHGYRAGVLLGFQTATAVELLDDAAGGTPQRFLFAAAVDPTVPAPDERPNWPGPLTVELPDATWRDTLDRGRHGRRRIHVAESARRAVLDDDHRRQTGDDRDQLGAHRNLIRLQVAAHLNVLLDGRPAVTDETWHLAGLLVSHSRLVIATITEHARSEAAARERETSERLAARNVNATAKAEAWRTVECARAIAAKVRKRPGVTQRELRQDLRRWRHLLADGLDHALAEGWVVERREPSHTGDEKRSFHPAEASR